MNAKAMTKVRRERVENKVRALDDMALDLLSEANDASDPTRGLMLRDARERVLVAASLLLNVLDRDNVLQTEARETKVLRSGPPRPKKTVFEEFGITMDEEAN